MTSSLSASSSGSAQWILKPILGSGREKRKTAVQDYLGDARHSLLSEIENGKYKCRVLCQKDDPTEKIFGIVIYGDQLLIRKFPIGSRLLDVKVLVSLEASSESTRDTHLDVLLSEIKDAGKERRAESLLVTLSRTESVAHSFFTRKGFSEVSDTHAHHSEERLFNLPLSEPPSSSNTAAADTRKRTRAEEGCAQLIAEANELIPPSRHEEKGEQTSQKRGMRESDHASRSFHAPTFSGYDALPAAYYPPHTSAHYHYPHTGYAAAAYPSPQSSMTPAPSKSGPRPLQVTLRKIYIHAIREGRKTIEGRVNSGMFQNLPVGREMRFFYMANAQDDVVCKVVKINKYASFREMVTKENYKACVPEAYSIDHAASLYEAIPGYVEKAQQYGVLAIHLERI
jgi:ASC-1-like (ASCH) protein